MFLLLWAVHVYSFNIYFYLYFPLALSKGAFFVVCLILNSPCWPVFWSFISPTADFLRLSRLRLSSFFLFSCLRHHMIVFVWLLNFVSMFMRLLWVWSCGCSCESPPSDALVHNYSSTATLIRASSPWFSVPPGGTTVSFGSGSGLVGPGPWTLVDTVVELFHQRYFGVLPWPDFHWWAGDRPESAGQRRHFSNRFKPPFIWCFYSCCELANNSGHKPTRCWCWCLTREHVGGLAGLWCSGCSRVPADINTTLRTTTTNTRRPLATRGYLWQLQRGRGLDSGTVLLEPLIGQGHIGCILK